MWKLQPPSPNLRKRSPFLSQQPLSKSWSPVKSPPFWKFGWRFNPPPPLPSRKEAGCTQCTGFYMIGTSVIKPFKFKMLGQESSSYFLVTLKVSCYLLTLSWRRPLSYRNLRSKSMDWFLYVIAFLLLPGIYFTDTPSTSVKIYLLHYCCHFTFPK